MQIKATTCITPSTFEEKLKLVSSNIGKTSISTLKPIMPFSKGPKSAITPVLPTDSVTFQPIFLK